MTRLLRAFLFLSLSALAACATLAKPVPKTPVMEEQPQPLPAGVKPLTVEQDEQISG